MPISIKMPALSPTMEEGTLAKWLVKVGDSISAGDLMAEIETDKATMEFEAVDEGTVASIAVEEGTENVAVGTVIMVLAEEGEDVDEAAAAANARDAAYPEPVEERAEKGEGRAEPAKAQPRETAEPERTPPEADAAQDVVPAEAGTSDRIAQPNAASANDLSFRWGDEAGPNHRVPAGPPHCRAERRRS